MQSSPFVSELEVALRLACQPTHMGRIVKGREQVLALPRDQVLLNIEAVAEQCIDWNDYWEYRRLLEVAEMLDAALVQRFVAIGLKSEDLDVVEAATDYLAPPAATD